MVFISLWSSEELYWHVLIPPSVPLQFNECIRPWQFSSLFEWLFILLFVLEPQNVQNLLLLMPKLFLLVPWQFITLALQRALSLCLDTTLGFQAIAMISLGILHINLALQKYCRSSLYHTHPPGQLEKCGNWALVSTTALMKTIGTLFYPDLWKDVVLNVSWHLRKTRDAVAIIGCVI